MIAVDIDNVVQDWAGGMTDLYRFWFDRDIWEWPREDYDWPLRVTHFETWVELFAWFNTADGWRELSYVPGAPGALYELQQANPNSRAFKFCTSRPPFGRIAASKLAQAWGVNIDFLPDASKHLAKADIWIDDSPFVLQNLIDHGKTTIRFARPWNEHVEGCTYTAGTWQEIMDLGVL